MKQTRKQKQGAAIAAVVCFVATIAIVGAYIFTENQNSFPREEMEGSEAETVKNRLDENPKDKLLETGGAAQNPVKNIVIQTEPDDKHKESESKKVETEIAENTDESVSGTGTAVYFSEGNKLLWPVDGTVLMSYSMDKTVYFPTLDQYKYNPAMILSAEQGDQVICGAPGIVKSIDYTAQTGTTVNIDYGNGFEAFYGQLCDVPVQVGSYVEAKTLLGYVSEPTKYYSAEGSNVYFEMRKDGQPVNPEDYLTGDW